MTQSKIFTSLPLNQGTTQQDGRNSGFVSGHDFTACEKKTWLARVSILRPGMRAQRAAFSKPATNRIRARLSAVP